MKEIFDWLREQITNVWKLKENPYDSYWNRAMYLEIKKENDKKEDAMRKMQEIIDEAEAKWKEDCCEWKWGIDYAQVQCRGDKILFGSRRLFTYCPYCGKTIAEVE